MGNPTEGNKKKKVQATFETRRTTFNQLNKIAANLNKSDESNISESEKSEEEEDFE